MSWFTSTPKVCIEVSFLTLIMWIHFLLFELQNMSFFVSYGLFHSKIDREGHTRRACVAHACAELHVAEHASLSIGQQAAEERSTGCPWTAEKAGVWTEGVSLLEESVGLATSNADDLPLGDSRAAAPDDNGRDRSDVEQRWARHMAKAAATGPSIVGPGSRTRLAQLRHYIERPRWFKIDSECNFYVSNLTWLSKL